MNNLQFHPPLSENYILNYFLYTKIRYSQEIPKYY